MENQNNASSNEKFVIDEAAFEQDCQGTEALDGKIYTSKWQKIKARKQTLKDMV